MNARLLLVMLAAIGCYCASFIPSDVSYRLALDGVAYIPVGILLILTLRFFGKI